MCRISAAKEKKYFSDKSDDFYLSIIENSRDILYLMDAKTGKFEYISPATLALSGFNVRETRQMGMKGINARNHPDDLHKVTNRILDLFARGRLPRNFNGYIEVRFRHKAGHYVWFGISRNFLTDKKGRIRALVGNVRDITETKLLQQELQDAVDTYKTLYNNARIALFRTRITDGRMLECNEFMAKMFGYQNRRECLAHCYTSKLADPEGRKELIKLLKEKGQVDNFEMKGRRSDGRTLWLKASARMYPNEGYIEGAVWDITIYKMLTETENKVLELIVQGKSSRQIASHLKRAVRTIEDHRSHIMRKLGAANLVELMQKVTESTLGWDQ